MLKIGDRVKILNTSRSGALDWFKGEIGQITSTRIKEDLFLVEVRRPDTDFSDDQWFYESQLIKLPEKRIIKII